MPKYKSPDGNGINIGGEHFAADADGCITVPNENYHTLLVPQGFELQADSVPAPESAPALAPESAPVADPVKAGFDGPAQLDAADHQEGSIQ